MNSNAWVSETPTGTPPAQTGIFAPEWVHDDASGLCFMTGGSTNASGGNLATVYVYNPTANAWLAALTNFTTPRNLHGAWIFGVGPQKMLCLAGGASSSTVLSSTQCYHFGSTTWGSENADLPVLPKAIWGFEYAKRGSGNSFEIWTISGNTVFAAIALTDQAWFYNPFYGNWIPSGKIKTSSIRGSAAVMNNRIYKVSGGVGSATVAATEVHTP